MSELSPSPSQETLDTLAEMTAAGIQLDAMMPVDFFILFEKAENAARFAEHIASDELNPKVAQGKCPDTGVAEVRVSVTMVPQAALIDTTEAYLESQADKFNGFGDGWGIEAE